MEDKIYEKTKEKNKKYSKLSNKPFHALEKPDFRIDAESLRY